MTVKENISAYAWTKTRQIIMEKQVKNISYWQVFPFPNLSFSPITLLILYSFSIVYQKFGEKTKKTCFHKCWNALSQLFAAETLFGRNIFSNQCRWRQNTNSRWFKVTQTSSPRGHDSPFKGSCCHHPNRSQFLPWTSPWKTNIWPWKLMVGRWNLPTKIGYHLQNCQVTSTPFCFFGGEITRVTHL